MKLIELHIIQSFPVSCLNRDDVGAPKTATFGGVTRARISSQCLKRAIRELARETAPELFAANRSRLIITPLVEALKKYGVDETEALKRAQQVGDYLATLDKEAADKGEPKVKTLMFLSPAEVDAIARALADSVNKGDKPKDLKKAVASACKSVALKDAADIAIFGRMVASDHSLTVEGAGLFSHALSTHKAENDIDFFSAVDDLQKQEEAGAGMTGTLEFTSATYYRYVGLNLDLLADENHLGALTQQQRKQVVDAFIRAAVLAIPGGRKNSMNAHTLPAYVLGLVKDKGQPIQLINAFEKPISSQNGFIEPSIRALKEHHEQLKKIWDIKPVVEVAIPEMNLNEFCQALISHVH
ncbi:MAG: type I-E CRISPR-associated protein Cas7/Cse4/CasC [Verrucomicrobiales bacterium]|nr:type I-E CRISPR-associated protein Cas7/Cse4/CasC [Verrucomicrobiales bacterium]